MPHLSPPNGHTSPVPYIFQPNFKSISFENKIILPLPSTNRVTLSTIFFPCLRALLYMPPLAIFRFIHYSFDAFGCISSIFSTLPLWVVSRNLSLRLDEEQWRRRVSLRMNDVEYQVRVQTVDYLWIVCFSFR